MSIARILLVQKRRLITIGQFRELSCCKAPEPAAQAASSSASAQRPSRIPTSLDWRDIQGHVSRMTGYLHAASIVPSYTDAVPLPGKTDYASMHTSFIIPGHLELEVDRLEVGANQDEIITDCSLEAEWTLRSEAVEGQNHEGMTGSRRYPRISFILAQFRNPGISWDILILG